jgi:small subunit ribosomal protein S1
MDEHSTPSHDPQDASQAGAPGNPEPQPTPAVEQPAPPAAAGAEPAPQAAATEPPTPAAAAEPPETAAAEPQPPAAAAEPQPAPSAAEQHPPQTAAAHDQPPPAGATQQQQPSPPAATEQQAPAAATAAQLPPPPETGPPSHAADQPQPSEAAAPAAAEEKKDFGAILAEFEHGQGGERQADAAAASGEGANGAGAGTAAGALAAPPAVPPTTRGMPNVGQKVSGKVVSIGDEQVFVDLGAKSEGMIEAAQLRNAEGQLTVKVGDRVDATVTAIDPESGVIVLRKKASGGRGGHQEVATELRQAFQYGMPVEGMVTGINKGGAEVQVYGMRAFCPLSQLDLRYVENPQQFIGQRLKFKVSRIEEGGRNRRPDVVLSRRALLEEEAQAKAAELRARLHVGGVLKGRVTSLTSYGAFIDLGGLEGLLHVSEIGYARVSDPREALSVGQEVDVQVIKIEKGKDEKRPERISLSRRALERDPWRDAVTRFPEGAVVPGRVMRLESFGAFVEVAPGLEGLVHVSELGAGKRLSHAREAVQTGQDVRVRVLNVDPVKRRISLSMTVTEERHEPVEETAPREPAAAAQQPPGSFGALGDFFKSSNQRRK